MPNKSGVRQAGQQSGMPRINKGEQMNKLRQFTSDFAGGFAQSGFEHATGQKVNTRPSAGSTAGGLVGNYVFGKMQQSQPRIHYPQPNQYPAFNSGNSQNNK
ncbi:hypothetical protein [Thalassomonas actiniarum]|uniref:Uncharacterized protein n=1 Tax=Thalassomonas actiniarum TaxID=485447 RepID=A0AAE9YY53_9GAMM|nr:hypothetical protein [Thalassomonas actiniarum]WDE01673.1 hypothetical protein SG35_014210 [Thalassomonas actiniarum]